MTSELYTCTVEQTQNRVFFLIKEYISLTQHSCPNIKWKVDLDMNSFILHVTAEPLCVAGAQSGSEGSAMNTHTASTLGRRREGPRPSLVTATCRP